MPSWTPCAGGSSSWNRERSCGTRPGGCTDMARRVGYYFRETAQGLKRNGLVAFAAVSTAFIALFLVGGALLVQREVGLLIARTEANVEVSVFLRDDISPTQGDNLNQMLHAMPEVASVHYESKEEA